MNFPAIRAKFRAISYAYYQLQPIAPALMNCISLWILASVIGDSGGPVIRKIDSADTFRNKKYYEQQYILSNGITSEYSKVGLYARVADRDILTWIQKVNLN